MRAVAACPVPVVSAVGHEQDTPLCDLAADARASTPTAAARLVVPDERELRADLDRLRTALGRDTRRIARAPPAVAGDRRERLTPRARAPAGAQAGAARRARRQAPRPLAAGDARAGLRHRQGGGRHRPLRRARWRPGRASTSSSPRAASARASRRRASERRAHLRAGARRAASASSPSSESGTRRPGGGGPPLGARRGASFDTGSDAEPSIEQVRAELERSCRARERQGRLEEAVRLWDAARSHRLAAKLDAAEGRSRSSGAARKRSDPRPDPAPAPARRRARPRSTPRSAGPCAG